MSRWKGHSRHLKCMHRRHRLTLQIWYTLPPLCFIRNIAALIVVIHFYVGTASL